MTVRIGLGMSAFPFTSPRAFWRWIEVCEDSPVDSIWQTDHLLSAEPSLEPLAVLAALAGGTRRLKFGVNVLVLPLREPLVLAKECATIDYLSGGRLLPAFGVGGDTAPEWRATGRDGRARGARSDEAMTILARLWAGDTVTFAGRHYQYVDARIAPLPVQHPLPMWIGGSSPAAIRRTALLGTGWIAGAQPPAEIAPIIQAIRDASAAAGRPIDDDHYGASFAYRFGSMDDEPAKRAAAGLARLSPNADPRERIAVGTADDILARVRAFREAGASKFILRPLGTDDDDIIDQTRRLIETVLPVAHAMA